MCDFCEYAEDCFGPDDCVFNSDEEETEEDLEEDHPCKICRMSDSCDGWEAQFCCTLCKYSYDGNTPCDSCDPMDI